MLAHAGTPDEQVAMITVVAGLWLGWAGLSRIRDRGFPRLPLGGAYSLAVVGAVIVVAGLTLPGQFMHPNPNTTPTPSSAVARPASTATLSIVQPEGSAVSGPQMEVVMTLEDGRIVDIASTKLTPDTGHVHLSLDGRLVSMTYGLVQLVDIQDLPPGAHTLEAEFVAADHGPFAPREIAETTFTIGGDA